MNKVVSISSVVCDLCEVNNSHQGKVFQLRLSNDKHESTGTLDICYPCAEKLYKDLKSLLRK